MECLHRGRGQGAVGRKGRGNGRENRGRRQMTRLEFLDTLRRRLAGLPEAEIDDLVADYATHFADGMAARRSEAEIAQALGDPMRLARELRAGAGFWRSETGRPPAHFFTVLFDFLPLAAPHFLCPP